MSGLKISGLLLALISSVLMGCRALAAPESALFGQLPQAHDAAISPDGNQIAILQNHKGTYLVNFVDLTGKKKKSDKPRVVALGEGVKPDFIKWADNHRVLVSVMQSMEFRRTPISAGFLYRVDSKTMEADLVLRPPRNSLRQFNNEVLDWLEEDPDHIIMQFADSGADQTLPDVKRINIETGRIKTIKKRSFGVRNWITDAQGEPRVGVGYRNNGRDAFMRILDPQTGNWEKADDYPGIDPESMYVVAVADEGRSLIFSAYRGRDTRGLHRYDLVARDWAETIYQNDEYDVGSVILSKDGNDIVGASFTGESTERVLFDEYNSTYEEALSVFEGFEVQFVDQSDDSESLLLKVSSPSEPGGLYLYERGGNVTFLLSNQQGLEASDMGSVVSVRYTARDGEKIPAFVTLPPSITDTAMLKNVPSIVLPHGGPFARDAKRFDWLAQFFATRGYLVLQMNFRGSEGYGKSFHEAGLNSWVVMQYDVEDGMRWLLEKGYADPEKSCIAGWSYGGYAALMGAAKTPDLYQCAIAIAALSDIPGAIADANQYVNGKARARRTFGALMDDRDLMRDNNPVQQTDKIKVPVFMVHGEIDAAVQIEQYWKMKRRLESAGVDGTYMEFEDEDHYMSNQANRQAMLEGIESFLMDVNGRSRFATK